MAAEQMRRQVGDAAFRIRQHAAEQDPRGLAGVGDHALLLDVGRRRRNARKPSDFLFLRPPVREPAFEAGNRGMSREAQNSRAQFFLETVHDGQHHDQHRDAQRETDHGDARDQRDEPGSWRGAQIPQS